MQFKYQTIFTCSVPTDVTLIKDFHEMLASDVPLTAIERLEIIKKSFENIGVTVNKMEITADNNCAHIQIKQDDKIFILNVAMRERPSLVIGDNIFKLEEFDI